MLHYEIQGITKETFSGFANGNSCLVAFRQCKSERRKAEERNNAGMDGSSLVLFSIRFCRRKHNGLTLPGYVPLCDAYTIADWTASQISRRPWELACRSKEISEWQRQNQCATHMLTCKNRISHFVKVWHSPVLRCSIALVRFVIQTYIAWCGHEIRDRFLNAWNIPIGPFAIQ